jgi:hypothetical protein
VLLKLSPLLLLVAACPGPESRARCEDQRVVGDASAPIELQLVSMMGPLMDGDAIGLSVPPQGGFVIYAGARARNLRACNVTMRAHLIDPGSGNALTNLDQRSADLLLETSGYWGPATKNLEFDLPNIPACPDALGVGIADREAILEVTVTDSAGKTARGSVRVVPRCNRLPRCSCVCGPNYQPGSC